MGSKYTEADFGIDRGEKQTTRTVITESESSRDAGPPSQAFGGFVWIAGQGATCVGLREDASAHRLLKKRTESGLAPFSIPGQPRSTVELP
jgi:hypothetical protein